VYLLIVVCLPVALADAGAIWSEYDSCPMPASSGFWSGPNMPHWAMPSVLLRRTAVAIKTAGELGASFVIVDFVINNNRS
jgi:hypothetical protein